MSGPIRAMRAAGVGDIKRAFVEREGQSVGLDEIAGYRTDLAAVGIYAVDVIGGLLARRLVALIVGVAAVGRISKPDAVVRLHHDIVGTIQPLARMRARQPRRRSVDLRAGHAPFAVFASYRPSLTVDGIAVGIVGGLAEDGNLPTAFVEPQHAIVGNVGPHSNPG